MNSRINASHYPSRHARAQAGVTLIETAVVASVLAVVAGLAVPGFDSSWQRHHLEGVAAQLETDIHRTRMLAVAHNETLRTSLETVAGASCYVIHRGATNQCGCNMDNSARCEAGATAERSVFFAAGGPLSMKSNSRSMAFDPAQGYDHADRHRAVDDAQRRRDPSDRQRDGARALLHPDAGLKRLQALLRLRSRGTDRRPTDGARGRTAGAHRTETRFRAHR
jgi:type IV fimbrial biogenesis protein FimT